MNDPISDAIIIYALDYDSCTAADTIDNMIGDNSSLITEIYQHILNNNEVIICVGSNRQDIHRDYENSRNNKTPSVFVAYPQFVEHINSLFIGTPYQDKINFNDFLTPDAQDNKIPGTTFKEYAESIDYIKKKLIPDKKDKEQVSTHEKYLLDETKISTIYAQMHMFALEHKPPKKIEFIVEEDQYEILQGLEQFYAKNADLIPNNMTLKLVQKISNTTNNAITDEVLQCIKNSNNTINYEKANHIIRANMGVNTYEGKSINGTGCADKDYAKTSTSMLIIAMQISTSNLAGEKAPSTYYTPQKIYNEHKKIIKKIKDLNNSVELKYGYYKYDKDLKRDGLSTDFLDAFNQYNSSSAPN